MNKSGEDKTAQLPLALQLTILFGALGILVALMYYSYIYPYPDGMPPDVWSFTFFWLREILILAFVVVVFAIIIGGWLLRLIRGIRRP